MSHSVCINVIPGLPRNPFNGRKAWILNQVKNGNLAYLGLLMFIIIMVNLDF